MLLIFMIYQSNDSLTLSYNSTDTFITIVCPCVTHIWHQHLHEHDMMAHVDTIIFLRHSQYIRHEVSMYGHWYWNIVTTLPHLGIQIAHLFVSSFTFKEPTTKQWVENNDFIFLVSQIYFFITSLLWLVLIFNKGGKSTKTSKKFT
jgi:hypothetical protein